MRIRKIKLREILASNSKRSIEVEVDTGRVKARFGVPMGTSKGKYEVKSYSYEHIVKSFSLIKNSFLSKNFSSQEEVDAELKKLDGTEDFRNIGGNLALAISSAFLKAFSAESNMEVFEYLGGRLMPLPLCNVAGGWHGSEIQEFLIFPKKQKSFKEEIFNIANIYLEFEKLLEREDKKFLHGKNLESAWTTSLKTEKILDLLHKHFHGRNIRLGVDVAGNYNNRKPKQQYTFISRLISKYELKYVEDPFKEDDFQLFASLKRSSKDTLICGDDLIATNLKRLEEAIRRDAVNAIIVKPNQIGTITDVKKVVEFAKRHDITTVISHRSGETEDALIAHLGVGLECEMAKIGISGERICKINEFIRIEEKLQES
ncbi:MAG: enolase C-terminal domain-like protein [Candidatus Aenigmatarchaeota archaeon]